MPLLPLPCAEVGSTRGGLGHAWEGVATQRTNTAVLVVIPHHDLVRRVARVAPAAHQCQDVASEEHLHDPDPAIGEVCTAQAQRVLAAWELRGY